nr:MAG TPA: hypothetical protein [Caudoviricetes sp.]
MGTGEITPVPICYVCYLLTIVFKNRQRRSSSSSVAHRIRRAISCSSHVLSFIPLLLRPSFVSADSCEAVA